MVNSSRRGSHPPVRRACRNLTRADTNSWDAEGVWRCGTPSRGFPRWGELAHRPRVPLGTGPGLLGRIVLVATRWVQKRLAVK